MQIKHIICRSCFQRKPDYHFTPEYLSCRICWPCEKKSSRKLLKSIKEGRNVVIPPAPIEAQERLPKRFKKFELQYFIFMYLLQHPCMLCGERNPIVLEFDHRDPKQKKASVSALINMRVTTERLLEEIALCDVLCANCHRIKTAGEQKSTRWRIIEYVKEVGLLTPVS